jgi:multicomponent Na+:H+ antiporter subunit E
MRFLLFLLWLCLNARVTPDVIISGGIIALLIGEFCRRFLGYEGVRAVRLLKMSGKFAGFLALLVWEMILANIAVIRLVLAPEMVVSPCLRSFPPPVRTPLGRVLLANAITLTPGTVTAELTEDGYKVHALTADMAAGLETSSFVRCIRGLEGEG